jgi:hypothetical protein
MYNVYVREPGNTEWVMFFPPNTPSLLAEVARLVEAGYPEITIERVTS